MTVALIGSFGLPFFFQVPGLTASQMSMIVRALPPITESHQLLNALDRALPGVEPAAAVRRNRFFLEGGIHSGSSFAGKTVFYNVTLPTANALFEAAREGKETLFANLGWEGEEGATEKVFSAAVLGYQHFASFLSKLLGEAFLWGRKHPQQAITKCFWNRDDGKTNGLEGAVNNLRGYWRDGRLNPQYQKLHRDEKGVTLYFQFPNGGKFDPSKKTVLLATEYHVGENRIPNQGGGIGVVPYLFQDRASYGLIASAANAAALFGGLKVFQEVYVPFRGDPMPFNVALLINILVPGAKVDWNTVLPKVPALKPDFIIAAANQFIGLPYSDDPQDSFVYFLHNRQGWERLIQQRVAAMTSGQPVRVFTGHDPEQSIFGALAAFYDQAKVLGFNIVDDHSKTGTAEENIHIPTALRTMAMIAGSLETVSLP